MANLTIGIDIGGTNSVAGIVDESGKVLVHDKIATPKHGDAKLYVQELKTMIDGLIAKVDANDTILGIGLGAPNGNYYNGTIEDAPNLAFEGTVHLVDMLKEVYPEMQAIALTNDANAATLGEMIYGGARGMKNFIMFTLGTGVGSGIVVNGDLVYGKDGFAGECGHFTIIPEGRLCGCGAKGHLEAYCSAPGMKRTAFELMAQYNDTETPLANKSFNDLEAKDIYDAAVAGDKLALEVFSKSGKLLGEAMATSAHHMSPEAIFLFGGPTAAGDLIIKPTIESFNDNLLSIFKGTIPVKISELSLGDAAIIGASSLVMNEINKA